VAVRNLDQVLVDHAHCERKAAATALSLINRYPKMHDLVRRCTRLAQEELGHFQAVYNELVKRGLEYDYDRGDPYVQQLSVHIRKGTQEHLMDRLLVAGIIEARSHERLLLLAQALEAGELGDLYRDMANTEAGHAQLFVDLATRYYLAADVEARLGELLQREAVIAAELPLEPRIH